MKVILKEDVPNLGSIGDIVTVKSKGYVRNFLLPKDLVLIANNTNQKMIERDLKKLEKKKQEQIAAAKTLAKTIDKIISKQADKLSKRDRDILKRVSSDINNTLNGNKNSMDKSSIC